MVDKYLEYLKLRGYSPLTRESYQRILEGFFSKHTEINDDTINQYRQSIDELSPASINQKLSCLRSFILWSKTDYDTRKIELKKNPQKQKEIITMDKVREVIKNEPNETIKVVIDTLVSTGMRVSELVNLDLKYLNRETGELQIVGKGGKTRIVFINNRIKDKITKLDVTSRTIERWVKKAGERCGVYLHPHMLRHIFATEVLNKNIDMRYVQEMLGHASILTTQRYTHVSYPKLRQKWQEADI